MRSPTRFVALLGCLSFLTGAGELDPKNPTCPVQPDWGTSEPMQFTTIDKGDYNVLVAEGRIDAEMPSRLRKALDADPMIGEIWIRSRGGHARAGNEAGRIIRSYGNIVTRIPKDWTCFSACNFMFLGGYPRFVDDGGIFMVHMFTHTGDRWIIDDAVIDGAEATTELIASIEQSSALLASEDNDFMIRMKVDRLLLTEVMYRQQARGTDEDPSTRYCLSSEEIRNYNVANGY